MGCREGGRGEEDEREREWVSFLPSFPSPHPPLLRSLLPRSKKANFFRGGWLVAAFASSSYVVVQQKKRGKLGVSLPSRASPAFFHWYGYDVASPFSFSLLSSPLPSSRFLSFSPSALPIPTYKF